MPLLMPPASLPGIVIASEALSREPIDAALPRSNSSPYRPGGPPPGASPGAKRRS